MKVLSDLTGSTIELIQPKLMKDNYELRSGEIVLGTLTFPRLFSTNAEVMLQDKKYEIKKESFWNSNLDIYKSGYEQPFAKYTAPAFKTGEVNIYGGSRVFVKTHLFRSFIDILDRNMKVVVHLKSKSGMKKKYLIDIVEKDRVVDENPWLILMLCYVIIRREKNSHSTAG